MARPVGLEPTTTGLEGPSSGYGKAVMKGANPIAIHGPNARHISRILSAFGPSPITDVVSRDHRGPNTAPCTLPVPMPPVFSPVKRGSTVMFPVIGSTSTSST